MEHLPKKKSKKESREYQALLGLIELYLKIGKPIGSSTLRENGFDFLSSATLRNYFSELEKEGFLKQPHSSGGRIPTNQAFRFYAEEMQYAPIIEKSWQDKLNTLRQEETKNVGAFLQHAAELFSEVTGYAIFLSSVRFDNDFILDIKFVSIDATRLLCIIITNFGLILTETLTLDYKLSLFSIKRIESYFHWRLGSQKQDEKPAQLTYEEELLAQKFYSEIMVRYLVRYSNFSDDDIHRTGFSKLLNQPEFNDPISLTTGLSLFENAKEMRKLLTIATQSDRLKFWIGEDLAPFSPNATDCAILTIPYSIHHVQAGAIGLLGPSRMPYRSLFGALTLFSEILNETLTKTLYKFKLTFRHPSHHPKPDLITGKSQKPLLEVKEKQCKTK